MKHISEVKHKSSTKKEHKRHIKTSEFILICFASLLISLICALLFLYFDAANLVVEFDSPVKVNEIIEKHGTEKNDPSFPAVTSFSDMDDKDAGQLFSDISNYKLYPVKKFNGLFVSLLLNKNNIINSIHYSINEMDCIDFSVHDVNGKIYLACVFPDSNDPDPDSDSVLTSIYKADESDNAVKDLSVYKAKSMYSGYTVYQYVYRFFERYPDAEAKDLCIAVSVSSLLLFGLLMLCGVKIQERRQRKNKK